MYLYRPSKSHPLPFDNRIQILIPPKSPKSVSEPIRTPSDGILYQSKWPGFVVYYANTYSAPVAELAKLNFTYYITMNSILCERNSPYSQYVVYPLFERLVFYIPFHPVLYVPHKSHSSVTKIAVPVCILWYILHEY